MLLENLIVGRVMLHEIFRRGDDRAPMTPRYGDRIVHLAADALDTFRQRVVDALGSPSQSLEMEIIRTEADSALDTARSLVEAGDSHFVTLSRKFADKLTEVQLHRNLPGGILLVFDGTAFHPARRIVGIIKAETHSGFTPFGDRGSLTLQYLRELILTPTTKLYKIGLFVEEYPSRRRGQPPWNAFIYDNLLVAADGSGAAQYFYESFLGCSLKLDSAHITRRFYDLTNQFISSSGLTQDEKVDLQTSLYTYLKVEVSPVVEVRGFAQRYLGEPQLRDQYSQFMAAKQFPDGAVSKNLGNLSGKLRRRRVVFKSRIQLVGPADEFNELVTIKSIDGETQPSGVVPAWTSIIVRDQVENLG